VCRAGHASLFRVYRFLSWLHSPISDKNHPSLFPLSSRETVTAAPPTGSPAGSPCLSPPSEKERSWTASDSSGRGNNPPDFTNPQPLRLLLDYQKSGYLLMLTHFSRPDRLSCKCTLTNLPPRSFFCPLSCRLLQAKLCFAPQLAPDPLIGLWIIVWSVASSYRQHC
jgi:hypothetical protein